MAESVSRSYDLYTFGEVPYYLINELALIVIRGVLSCKFTLVIGTAIGCVRAANFFIMSELAEFISALLFVWVI